MGLHTYAGLEGRHTISKHADDADMTESQQAAAQHHLVDRLTAQQRPDSYHDGVHAYAELEGGRSISKYA